MSLQAHHHHHQYPTARGFVRLLPVLLSMAAAQGSNFFKENGRESVHKKKEDNETRAKRRTPKKAKDYIEAHHQPTVWKGGKKVKSHGQLQRESEERERRRAIKDRERQDAEMKAYLLELERLEELRRKAEQEEVLNVCKIMPADFKKPAVFSSMEEWKEALIKWAPDKNPACMQDPQMAFKINDKFERVQKARPRKRAVVSSDFEP
jgi:hypothetical protein